MTVGFNNGVPQVNLTGQIAGAGLSTNCTASTLTQFNALVGGASNAITSVAPSATSGVPLISQGAASNPAFGTAVVAGGGTGQTSLTAHSVLIGNGTSGIVQVGPVASTGAILASNGAASDPGFTTATYPLTTAANTMLISTSANTVTTATFIAPTSFTPTLNFGGATTGITYSTQVGFYAQIGKMVSFSINIALSSKGSATGSATITGLPVTSANDGNEYTFLLVKADGASTTTGATFFYADLAANSSTLSLAFQTASTGGAATLADTNFVNTSIIRVTGLYFSA